MIETLRVADLKIVEEVELDFVPGLNVLTGETGAGKSVILGALALLAGGRGGADEVREGAEEGVVEAVFRTDHLAALEADLARRDLVPDEREDGAGRELVVRRSVKSSGRSRVRVAGEPLPVSSLAELFAGRIEISSQHSSQALLRPETHGRFLDEAGGLSGLRGRVAEGHARLVALDRELSGLRAAAEERARRLDFLGFQLREIDEAALDPAEIEAIAAEHARLAHAERLGEDGAAALALLAVDAAAGGEAANAGDLVGRAQRGLEGLARLDPGLEDLAGRLGGVEAELADVARDLERYLDAVEADPGRLSEVESRLALVERLRGKYGGTVEEILAYRDRARDERDATAGADARVDVLAKEREEWTARLTEDASKLSAGRVRAARKLAKATQACLASLAMPHARFAVHLEPDVAGEGLPCGPLGAEVPEFRFAANPDGGLRPLSKVASGGELSRVFLAVRNALRPAGQGMVLVFDEVDAGVGGNVAERVGRALFELTRYHQVLCITHLPQIAAFADAHFVVRKSDRAGRTLVTVAAVEGDERVDEIARMAAGESVTAATREHALELLRAKDLA